MSQLDFYAILDECVSRLNQGDSPEACLAKYPSQNADLAPDLALAAELIHLSPSEPSPDAVADGYQKMMAALDTQGSRSPLASLSAFLGKLAGPLRPRQHGLAATLLRAAAIAVVVLAAAGSLVVSAAADTLPGDALYPVKRSWENTRLSFTLGDSSRQALQSEFDRLRREEVKAVVDLRRPVVVEFTGVVDSIFTEDWQVDGLDLHITDETQVSGAAGGAVAGGAVTAGQSITVRAQVKDDGSLNALDVVVDVVRPTSEATPAFTPQPTQPSLTTPGVVAPSPTASLEETRPKPTSTAKPTERPSPPPTSTPLPSIDRQPTPKPLPTNTPSTDALATSTPRATATPANTDPTPTSRPADLAPPTPTATSPPRRDSKPTPTPTPTRNTDTGSRDSRPP